MIQAIVNYWSGVAGHVSIIVNDLDSDKSFYINFAGGNHKDLDYEYDATYPIEIELPPIPTDITTFEEQFRESIYYLSPETLSFLISNLSKEPDSYPEEYNDYLENYHLLSNNCAHAVISVLQMAGYLEKADFAFKFRPYSVAREATEIATNLLKTNYKQDLKQDINFTTRVEYAIDFIVNLLKIQLAKERIASFPKKMSIEAIIDDIKQLNSVEVDALNQAQIITKVLDIIAQSRFITTITEFKKAYESISIGVYNEITIVNLLCDLKTIRIQNSLQSRSIDLLINHLARFSNSKSWNDQFNKLLESVIKEFSKKQNFCAGFFKDNASVSILKAIRQVDESYLHQIDKDTVALLYSKRNNESPKHFLANLFC